MQAPCACRVLICLALVGMPAAARAADEVGTTVPASPVSVPGLLQVIFALLLVLAAIGLIAWLVRRIVPGQGSASGLLKVVGGVMIGPRERLVLVEIDQTWLFLGVAANSVTLVHTMPRPAGVSAESAPQAGAFQRLLGQALRKKPEQR